MIFSLAEDGNLKLTKPMYPCTSSTSNSDRSKNKKEKKGKLQATCIGQTQGLYKIYCLLNVRVEVVAKALKSQVVNFIHSRYSKVR